MVVMLPTGGTASGSITQQLLRMEILCGLDSPAAMSGERLKLQVEALQSSLKSGQREMTRDLRLQEMVSLPARVDADTSRRMLAVMNSLSTK